MHAPATVVPSRCVAFTNLNLRVDEVGISYAGRTYEDGKKIGWRDGVWAIVCIVKYSPIGQRLRRLAGRFAT